MPRPKLPPERRRGQLLTVPMCGTELAELCRVAAEQHVTMAELVRGLVSKEIASHERRKRRA